MREFMPLSWNEIRTRAVAFSKDWAEESSEHAEAKTFWDDLFNIFGVSRRRIASFEQHVKKRLMALSINHIAFLFDLYQQYTSLLPKEEKKPKKRN